jgi:sugar lactone lactonase YvrE
VCFARAWLVALCSLWFCGTAGSATFPEIEKGLSWLDDQPRLDGTLLNEVLSVAAVLQARAEAFTLLQSKASVPAPAVDALLATAEDNTEFIARKAIVAGFTGRDGTALTALLVARQNADGGFAPAAGYQSSVLDTAWGLLALRAVGFGDAAVIESGLGFLAQRANADGGYGPMGRSDLFHTAYVLMGLRAHSARFGAPPAAQLAFNWIAGRQAQGGYGDVIDNAVATLALHAASMDNALYAGAVAALRAAQSADGSWGGDPYATALALSALIAADGIPSPDLTGSVSATLRDPVSGAPIAGAQIVVTGPTNLTVFSGPAGAFLVSGLIPGQYTLEVSKAGYATMLATVRVAASTTASLGSLQVPRAATTATLQGRVTDGGTGAPLAGVSVSVQGMASAVTDAAGAYAITGLLPGAFTVIASRAGYDSASGAGHLEAGRTSLFSPGLYASGQTPTEASVRGRLVDRDTDVPLPGATVSVGALTATTDSSGAFSLTGFAPGTTGIEFAAGGYQTASFIATLSAGVNELGTVELARQPATLTLSGRVIDAETSLPIGGALVQLTGADTRATSDPAGVYRLDGIGVPEFALSVSAPGYSRHALNVSLPALGDTTVDIALERLASDGLTIRSVRTDKPAYDPYTSIEIEVEVVNTSGQERRIVFVATVFDLQGRAVIDVPARGVVPTPVALAPNAQNEIELETYAADEQAGLYSVEVRGYDDSGELALQGSASFSLNPVRRFAGGIQLDPPIAQADTHQPVGITLSAYNHGNLPVPAGPVQLVVTLDRPDPSAGQRAQSIAQTILSGPPLNGAVAAVYDAQGVLYAVDRTDRKVLRIAPDGTVSTLATLPTLFTNPSVAVNPVDIALDAAGDLYVLNQTLEVFKVSAGGTVTRIRTGLATHTAFHLDAGGAFYILEKTTNTASLSRFTPGGVPVVLIGKGLSRPVGMAVGSDGLVYVANFGDNSIVRLTSTGAVQLFVTGLNRPQGMVADAAGNLFVANSGANNVVKITPDGLVSVFATGLNDPYALAFDSVGDLLVTNRRDATIARIRSDGSAVAFTRGLTRRPQGMRYDAAGNLYVVGDNGISRLSASGSIALVSTVTDGWGIALGPTSEPYLTRPGAGQVVRIGSTGTVQVASGLASPQGLAFDAGGTLYVAESNAARISAIDGAGQRSTVAESYLDAPEGVAAAPNGDVYVLNAASIGRLTATGGARLGQGLSAARSMALGPDGDVYLEEITAIRRVDASGTATLVRSGLPTLALGIALDQIGNIYVAETAARELKRLEPGGAYTRVATFGAQPLSLTRDALGMVYVLLSTGQILSVDETGAVARLATVSGATRIARHSGDKLYLLHSAGVKALDLTTKTVTSLIAQSGLTALAVSAAGELLVVHGTRNELQVYDEQGTVLRTAAGFAGLRDLVWTGSELVFNAGSFLYALAPGGLPRIAGSGPATRLDARDGVIYATSSGGLSRLAPNGTLQLLFSQPGFVEPSGVAARADGALSVASLTTDRVLTVSQAGQVIASYAGINTLSGVAVDAQDNVYAVSDSGRRIVRIAPDGVQSTVFATGSMFDMLAFDASGQLHATSAKELRRFDGLGAASVVATSPARPVSRRHPAAVRRDPGRRSLPSMVRKANAGELAVFSAGLDDPRRIKVGPDGAAYVVSWANGTVLRVTPGAADLYAANLVAPTALDFGAGGALYIAEASGQIVRVDPSGAQTRHEDLGAVLGAIDVDALTVGPSQTLAVARSRANDLVKVTLLPALPAPQPGTVVHTAIAPLAEIATGPAPVTADFGSWVPPYSGDFRFGVRSLTGVEGEAVNLLHVGPGASGAIVAARDVLPPGDAAPLAVQLSLRGADLSTVTRVEAGNVRLYATKVIDLTPGSAQVMPRSIGADAAGNVYFTFNKDLRRVAPGADPVVVYRGTHLIQMVGGIPVDDAQNLYVTGGDAGRDVLRIAQDGGSTTVASLTETILSLVRDSRDDLYALSASRIHRIRQDGSVTALGAAGIDRPVSLTIDGHDNLYVHNLTNEVVKIARDGSVSAVVADPEVVFEYEGVNIAGDCAGNLFVTPYRWPAVGQDGEEHTLAQVAGATGQVTQVLDGRTIHSDLTDMDLIVYDRFGGQLLIWTDTAAGRVYSVPVRCGVIDAGLHLVLPPGQQASGFSTAPSAVVDRSDGSTEYVWSLEGVGEAGRSIQFDSILHGLTLGEERALAAEGFLLFTNTFVAEPVKVPLSVPTVRVEAPVRLDVATDRSAYAPGSLGYADLRLTNQDASTRQGRLVGEIVDRAGLAVSRVADQSVTLPGGATTDVLAPFDTATWPPGAYTVTATIVAGDVELARASAALHVLTGEPHAVPPPR